MVKHHGRSKTALDTRDRLRFVHSVAYHLKVTLNCPLEAKDKNPIYSKAQVCNVLQDLLKYHTDEADHSVRTDCTAQCGSNGL